jgi:CheY-like chemotaxis protein
MLNSNKLILNPKTLKDLQILVVDNDRDNRDFYAFLLESYGAQVTTTASIKGGLALLNKLMPSILICEMRFLGENVYPLIRRVRYLALKSGSTIPILITSTCSIAEFTQQWRLKTEAYLLKPVNLENFIDEVWKLTQGSRSLQVGRLS